MPVAPRALSAKSGTQRRGSSSHGWLIIWRLDGQLYIADAARRWPGLRHSFQHRGLVVVRYRDRLLAVLDELVLLAVQQ